MKIEHDPNAQRFSARFDDGDAYVAYHERPDGTLDLQHTIVPPEEQNRGVGGELVQHVLDHARREDLRIVPSCPFVAAWIRDHPEYEDLVATG